MHSSCYSACTQLVLHVSNILGVPCVVEKLSPYSESSKNSPSTNQSSPSFGGRTDKQESSGNKCFFVCF